MPSANMVEVNSRLTDTSLLRTPRYYGHLVTTDTPLIRTAANKSPAKITDISLKQTPAITDFLFFFYLIYYLS